MPSGQLTRQSTVVGKPKTKARAQRGYMKKTTRRGAYKRNRKKQFMIRNAPFKETKSKTSEDLVDQGFLTSPPTTFYQSNTPHKHINPEVFF